MAGFLASPNPILVANRTQSELLYRCASGLNYWGAARSFFGGQFGSGVTNLYSQPLLSCGQPGGTLTSFAPGSTMQCQRIVQSFKSGSRSNALRRWQPGSAQQ